VTGHTPTRIEHARLRAAWAKRAAAGASAAAFLVALLLARASHPGHAGTAASTSSGSAATGDVSDDDGAAFDFGSGSIGPAGGGVSGVRSGVS